MNVECAVKKSFTCSLPTTVPTAYGVFTAIAYSFLDTNITHLVLIKGDVVNKTNVLVRIHSECVTGDVFNSKRCDCGHQLKEALKRIEEEGEGIVIYLRDHEGRGIGLTHKLSAYHLQERGIDTVDANILLGLPIDAREYKDAASILFDLNISSLRLLTNNPKKAYSLLNQGIVVEEILPLLPFVTEENRDYLKTKQTRMGHLIDV